jgi:hypothetical protein
MAQIVRRIKSKAKSIRDNMAVRRAQRSVDRAKTDPLITYPCYKSFDEFIDVERLKSLDRYITERIEKHIRDRDDEKFHTGTLTLGVAAPKVPGSRIIYLSQYKDPTRTWNYYELDETNLWGPSDDAAEFPLLMDFIETLPFKSVGRMMIMYDGSGNPVTAHRDHSRLDTCHEFVWFRTTLTKPFYMFNQKTGEKKYVESYSAWFDTCNQFHGVDAKPGLAFSVRVDGTFSDEFRARIPVPQYNRASTSALWACSEKTK